MLANCCSFNLAEMIREMANRCNGCRENGAAVANRVTALIKTETLDIACTGRLLTEEEADEAHVSLPAVAFSIDGNDAEKWYLCSMEPIKTASGTVFSVFIDTYKNRMRISSPYWAGVGAGADPEEYLTTPDQKLLRQRPSIKDFFDNRLDQDRENLKPSE